MSVAALPGLAADAAGLAALTSAGDAALAQLPPKPERTREQQWQADAVHRREREARRAFLERHVEAVYHAVTDDLTLHLRAPELVYAVADQFPGLVPTREKVAREAQLPQAAKEGREIDQGLLLSAVLASPVTGPHLLDSMLMPTPRALALVAEFSATGQLGLDAVHLQRQDGATTLTVHNEHCLNAEDNALIADMETAVDLVLLDPHTRVGALRGGVMTHPRHAGRRVFSAGINLKHLHAGRISFVDFLIGRELGYIHKIYRGLLPSGADAAAAAWPHRFVHKPWAAAVDTFAIGGGAQLLLVFDHVVAASDAYFSLPAAQEGIVPGAGGFRLGRHVGARLTRQIILAGERVWASSAQGLLVFDEVVEPAAVDAAFAAALRRLDSPAVVANRRILNAVEEPVEAFRQYLAHFALEQCLRLYSDDVIAKVGRRAARAAATS